MAERSAGNTALGAAVCRLIEQYQPEATRLFDDPVVKDLVGAPIRVMMQVAAMRNFTIKQTDAIADGIYGAQICRTRFIDDVGNADYQAKYLQPLGRNLAVFEGERIAQAVVTRP
jgi:O-methyltransferase involved in polyketide biosynthesis